MKVHLSRALFLALALGLGYLSHSLLSRPGKVEANSISATDTFAPERMAPADKGGKVTPNKFAHLEAREVTVTFVIRGAKKTGQRFYLNDQPRYDAEGVQTVVVDLDRVPSFKAASPYLIRGKTVTATGEATERGVLVTDEGKLDVR